MKVIKGKGVSKTARASMYTAPVAEKVVLTPEQAIQEIRNLRVGKLSVGNMEYVDKLLGEYDRICAELAEEVAEYGTLQGKHSELDAEYGTLHAEYGTLHAKHDAALTEIASLRNEVVYLADARSFESARPPNMSVAARGFGREASGTVYPPEPTSIIGIDEIIG